LRGLILEGLIGAPGDSSQGRRLHRRVMILCWLVRRWSVSCWKISACRGLGGIRRRLLANWNPFGSRGDFRC